MQKLIEAIEQAQDGAAALDIAIAIAIGDLSEVHYTRSIDSAIRLIPAGLYWVIGSGRMSPAEPLGGCSLYQPGAPEDWPDVEAEAATVPLAICAAALKARKRGTS